MTKAARIAQIRRRLAREPEPETVAATVLCDGWPAVWEDAPLPALSSWQCQQCGGAGRLEARGTWRPCGCVLRRAFQEVWSRVADIREQYPAAGCCAEGQWMFGRKAEEFVADALLVARRVLHGDQWRLFDLHYVHDAEWADCIGPLGTSKGNFFHAVYQVQERVGRAWVETRPYPLFPVRQYFAGRFLTRSMSVVQMQAEEWGA